MYSKCRTFYLLNVLQWKQNICKKKYLKLWRRVRLRSISSVAENVCNVQHKQCSEMRREMLPLIRTPWIHCCLWPCRTVYICPGERRRRTSGSTASRSRWSPGSADCCTSHTAPLWSSSLKSTHREQKLSVEQELLTVANSQTGWLMCQITQFRGLIATLIAENWRCKSREPSTSTDPWWQWWNWIFIVYDCNVCLWDIELVRFSASCNFTTWV